MTNDQRIREIRDNLRGLTHLVQNTPEDDKEAWADISKRFGACQRRSRLIAGLGRGG